MALTNIVSLGTTFHNTIYTYNRTPTVSGAVANVYDNNDSTYFKIFNVASGAGSEFGTCDMTSEHTWSTPVSLKTARVKMYTRCYSLGNYANRGVDPRNLQQIFLRISGVWTLVWQFRSAVIGGDSQPNEIVNTDQAVYTGWENVTGIKVYMYCASYAYEGARYNDTTCQLFEVQAYGVVDSKLRIYDGSAIEKIGTEPLLSTHKLRMYDGSDIVGVPLVAPAETYASKARVYDGSSVQSLVKYN